MTTKLNLKYQIVLNEHYFIPPLQNLPPYLVVDTAITNLRLFFELIK